MSAIFVSHSSQDVAWCQAFVAALRAAGHTCFFDHDSIPGSVEWLDTIQDGVLRCDLCVLILSPVAWASPWVKREWQMALRLNKPILPVEYHPTPEATTSFLGGYQGVKADGLDGASAAQRTVAAMTRLGYSALPPSAVASPPPAPSSMGAALMPLPARLVRLGFSSHTKGGVEYIVPPVCAVPTGPFIMSSDTQHDSQARDDEQPQHQAMTGAYEIGMYPLTVAEYACAVVAKAVKVPPDSDSVTWEKQQQCPDHPVVCVSWLDAHAYAAWLTEMTGHVWRLPTEAEWEKAARGTDGRIYPWGNSWDKARANSNDDGPGITTPVGLYAAMEDASPYGAHEMAGNVWEWTSDLFQSYPYRAAQIEQDADTTSQRVMRGGSWFSRPTNARAVFRYSDSPHGFHINLGVRLARSAAADT